MSARIKVVFCTDGIFPHAVGGMQKHSKLLIEEIARMNVIDLVVIHPHHNTKVFAPELNIKEHGIDRGKKYWSYLYNEYKYSVKVYNILKNYTDAVIYSQGLSVWHGIKKIGHRVIINPHGLEFLQAITLKTKFKALRFEWIFRRIFNRAAKVVSLGGRLTPLLRSIVKDAGSKVVVLPNAVNLPSKRNERTYSNKPMQLLFVGRFAANKGIDVLMQAIESLNKEGYKNELHFNLIGKGPLYEHYTKNFQAPNITYHGFADDDALVKAYEENDVFVLPTLFEGMPTVILEAMTHGMPIIVTDTGATTELVNNKNGYIIEKKEFKSLKAAITAYYLLDEDKKKKMSDESYRKVSENFTWNVVARQHVDLFKSFSVETVMR